MTTADDAAAELLAQSLVAWGVGGECVRAGDGGLEIRAAGRAMRVERAPPALPFRWMVTIDGRRRGAASLVGVMRQARTALDPGYATSRVRIAVASLAPP